MAKQFNANLSEEDRIKKHRRTKADAARIEQARLDAASSSRKIELGDMPPYFNGHAQRRFEELVPLLETLTINLHDLPAVERYCILYAEFIEAVAGIEMYGMLIEGKKNPLITVRNDAAKEMRSLENQLQMTPALRMKTSSDDAKSKEKVDPFFEFMKGGDAQ